MYSIEVKKRLLKVEELAALMGSTPKTIYSLKCRGEIPANCIVKRGKSLRFDIVEVEKWIDNLKGEAIA